MNELKTGSIDGSQPPDRIGLFENDMRKCLCKPSGTCWMVTTEIIWVGSSVSLVGSRTPSKKYASPDGAHVVRVVCKYNLIEAVRS